MRWTSSSFGRVLVLGVSCAIGLAAVTDCGNSDDAATGSKVGSASDGGVVAPASGSIGAAGGTVAASDGTSVTIPAGALSTTTTITVTPSPGTPLSSAFTAVGPVYVMGLEGLQFASAVTLTLDVEPSLFPAGTTESNVQVYTAPVGSTAFTTLPTLPRDATHVTAPTTHFSIFVAGIPASLGGDGGTSPPGAGSDAGGDGGGLVTLPDGGVVDTVPTPNETAGTRLHPMYARTDYGDGAVTLARVSMYDEQRQEPCDATMLPDGNTYCAPSGPIATLLPSTYFTDASCKTPILGVQSTYTPPACGTVQLPAPHHYILTQDVATCGAPTHVWSAPDSARLPTGTIYELDGLGRCDAIGFDATQQEAYPQSVLTELAPADLVRLTSSSPTDSGTSRLRAAPSVLTGSDGSKWSTDGQLVDTQTGSFCTFSWGAADKTQRCTPNWEFYEWYANVYYSDATCKTPEYDIIASSTCSTDSRNSKTYAYSGGGYDSDGCFDTDTVSIASNAPAKAFYSNYPCTAVASAGSGSDTYYTGPVPSVVAPSTFVAVTQTTKDASAYGVNGSRIHAQNVHTVGNDGSDVAQLATVPVDTQAQLACTPMTLGDGAVHCIPPTRSFSYSGGPSTSALYADAACSQKVVTLVTPARPICTRSTPPQVYIESAGTSMAGCATTNVYRGTGTPLPTTATLYSKASGTCAASGTATNVTYLASDMVKADPSEFITESLSLETR